MIVQYQINTIEEEILKIGSYKMKKTKKKREMVKIRWNMSRKSGFIHP
jgi:hypothetical protein